MGLSGPLIFFRVLAYDHSRNDIFISAVNVQVPIKFAVNILRKTVSGGGPLRFSVQGPVGP